MASDGGKSRPSAATRRGSTRSAAVPGAASASPAAQLKRDEISYILAQWVDIHGTPRCKGVPASAIEAFLGGSAGFAGAATVGMGQGPHSHDLVGMPDFDSYTVVPWETGVARVACDITVDGEAWPYCSRTVLKRAIERLAAAGYEYRVGIEAEHMLVSRRPDGSIVPYDPTGSDTLEKPCYDFKGLSANLPYLRELIGYMEGLGWEPYASDHEDGTAQFELNWKYADALTTADRYTFFKMMTNQVAQRHGAIATHMPKPFSGLTGNGSHFHMSLWDEAGRQAFVDPKDPRGLGQSKLAYQFLGGLMAHARALAAIIAPTVNCYKRLSIGHYLTGARSGFTWVPAFITYGDNNRTHMFRVPEPGSLRVPGRVRGRESRTSPWPRSSRRASTASSAASIRASRSSAATCTTPRSSRCAPRASGTSPRACPRRSTNSSATRSSSRRSARSWPAEFITVKRQEWVRYHNAVGQWEVDQYLTLF